MLTELNKNYLITTHNWFVGPDGNQYKGVFGKVTGIHSDTDTLGIATNRHSTNWYLTIGNMIIAGCQVFYAIKTDNVKFDPPIRDIEYEGKLIGVKEEISRIYNANTGEV